MRYYVYIMSSKSRVLYVGVTGFLMARVMRHKAGERSSFTSKYRIHRLVYYQAFQNIGDAIARETEIKNWSRTKKVELIRNFNPTWEDLAADWGKPVPMQLTRKTDSSAAPLRNDKMDVSDKE
jgi:putative endonuclease